MPTILSLFITIIILCLVFSLAYWIVTLVSALLPPPIRQPATTLMLVLLALLALCWLLDMVGLFGTRHMIINLH